MGDESDSIPRNTEWTKWQEWFAWYPVKYNGKRIWFTSIFRRTRKVHGREHIWTQKQYITLHDYLKN
jgi:hypothetical protein